MSINDALPTNQDSPTGNDPSQISPTAPVTSTAAPVSNGTPQPAPQDASQQSAPGQAAPVPAKLQMDENVTPPPPTAAQQKAVTLATKSPNPVAQHVHDIAETLAGGGRYVTTYDDTGNPIRHKVPVSTAHLGLALAMEVLRGGLAGASGNPVGAGARGMAQGDADAAKRRQAQLDSQNQANEAQTRALGITKANLELHQMALNVGKQDEATNRAMDATYAPVMKDLEENHPDAIQAKVPEWGLNDYLQKHGNITRDMAIPYDTVPVLDPKTGEQAKHADGSPVWGHMYAIVDPSIKTTLSDETQTMGYNVGQFKSPDGSQVQMGNPGNWPLSDIIARHTKYAQISVAEGLLNRQIAELKGIGEGEKQGPKVSLADQVRQDPTLLSAVEDYSKYAGVGGLDQIIYTMGQSADPTEKQSAARIMQLAGITADELEEKHNERIAAAKRANEKPIEPNTAENARMIVSDPRETPARKQVAQKVLDMQQQSEVDKENRVNQNRKSLDEQKQDEKDKRTMGYVEDQHGDIYHVSLYDAQNNDKYAGQTFVEKKPSDVSKDMAAIKPINDIQNNINGYQDANRGYGSAGLSAAQVSSDRDNLKTIFSAPTINDAAAAHAGVEGFGITIPTVSADLNKGLADKVLGAYNNLSPQGKKLADTYVRLRGAIPAYVKVITNSGRGSKEQLDLELQNILPPYYNQADISHRTDTFQGNLNTQKTGFPKNLAGAHFVEESSGQGKVTVTSGSKTFTFPNQAAADAFKKQAGIR